MTNSIVKIRSRYADEVILRSIEGHFATSESHITHYLDTTAMRTRCSEAANVAHALSQKYEINTPVDTIVCLDGLEVVGAYLTDELTKSGVLSMNAHKTMYVIPAEYSGGGQIMFRDNLQPMIKGKNIIILISSITTGATISKAINSVLYYGGIIQGVSAIFSAATKVAGMDINALFYKNDVPNYQSYKPMDCPACKKGQKIDAIVNSFGYSKI